MRLAKKTLIDILKRNNMESAQVLRKGVESTEMPGELAQNRGDLPLESSDTSESDEDKNHSTVESNSVVTTPATCPIIHEGRMLLNEVFPIAIDDFFTLIFSYNKFNVGVWETMKYTDPRVSNWEEDPATGLKKRTGQLVVPLTQPMGPKTCLVTETQVIQACSKPGVLYVIDVEAVNSGVPYCDSFYIANHFCLTRVSGTETNFTVHSQIKYRKSVWGLIKSFIEKNAWAGLEDYFKTLKKALDEECNRRQFENGEKVTSSHQQASPNTTVPELPVQPAVAVTTPSVTMSAPATNEMALWIILGVLTFLLLLNTILYYKLSALETSDERSTLSASIDTEILSLTEKRSNEEWISLLRKQAVQHQKEIDHWKENLKSVVSLLSQAEESIINLQKNVQSIVNLRVSSALNTQSSESDDITLTNKHDEL